MITTVLSKSSSRPEPLEFKGDRSLEHDEEGIWYHDEPVGGSEGEGVYLAIKIYELPEDCGGAHKHKWAADLVAVSPFLASDAAICSAISSNGEWFEEAWETVDDPEKRIRMLCDLLIDHGTCATILCKTSTRYKGPFKGCASEARVAHFMFGFLCDRQANAYGDTGWDFLKGEIGPGKGTWFRKPTAAQLEIIGWLNNHYPERAGYGQDNTNKAVEPADPW